MVGSDGTLKMQRVKERVEVMINKDRPYLEWDGGSWQLLSPSSLADRVLQRSLYARCFAYMSPRMSTCALHTTRCFCPLDSQIDRAESRRQLSSSNRHGLNIAKRNAIKGLRSHGTYCFLPDATGESRWKCADRE